jgi:hypothetical protein
MGLPAVHRDGLAVRLGSSVGDRGSYGARPLWPPLSMLCRTRNRHHIQALVMSDGCEQALNELARLQREVNRPDDAIELNDARGDDAHRPRRNTQSIRPL